MNYNRFTEFSETNSLILTKAKGELLNVMSELNEIEKAFNENVSDYAMQYRDNLDSVTLHVCIRDFLRADNRLTDYNALKAFFKARKAYIIYQYERLLFTLRELSDFYLNYEIKNNYDNLLEKQILDKIDELNIRKHIREFLKLETNVTNVYLINLII